MRQQSFAASATFALALLAAGAVGIGSVPAHARQNAQNEVKTSASRAEPTATGEKKICRRMEVTGSRMDKGRVCLTAEQWKKVEEEAR